MRGATIDRVDRHGKELALVERGPRRLRMRLGMTGRLLVAQLREPALPNRVPHEHVRWIVRAPGGSTWLLRSIDPRRFGDLVVFETPEAFETDRARLGPDAASIRAPDLRRHLAGTRRAIKVTLLDQAVLAGVGNIYADEALFAAGIHPATPACLLGRESVGRLAAQIRRLLRRATDAGGTTIRDYQNGEGRPGEGQKLLLVYGRRGQACRRCKHDLEHTTLGQRSTTWCPSCQQSIHTAIGAR